MSGPRRKASPDDLLGKPLPATGRSAAGKPATRTAPGPAASHLQRTAKPRPVRRRDDPKGMKPRDPDAKSGGVEPVGDVKHGGRLRNEIVIPVGIGGLVMCAALGFAGSAASKLLGGGLFPVLCVTTIVLVAALMAYVAWIVDSVAARPLARVRAALQEMEDGNYDARLAPDGAVELWEVAQGFNRMATIVSHQRERLKVAAATDSLTGLANHRHFQERLRGAVQAAREHKLPLAVAAIDVDGFKKVNDERGHARGDEALKDVGEALKKAVRGSDLVARLGGDDFMLILEGADPGFARDVTERAREAVMRALPDEIALTASAGFVCFPENADEDANFSELASSALDVAKRHGGNQTRKYDSEQVSAIPTIRQQRAEIDELLESEAPITPVFQPLVELTTGRLVGYEALSRFNAEIKRSPDAWFNQAQRVGRGLQLEAAAIKTALAAPGRPPGTYLSLNFSPSAISSSKMLAVLPHNLSDVVIEITEHELAAQDGGLEEGLARLRARGARIAVDDAGAGYAGLNQVMRVQPNVIKLDRSLIEGVHADSAKSALIEFFVLFARRVGAAVCTEGIETLDELRCLINLGVTLGQGYLLGRPADPWSGVSDEIARALATGALRTHAATPRMPVQGVPVGAPQRGQYVGRTVGSAQHIAGPINRRLGR